MSKTVGTTFAKTRALKAIVGMFALGFLLLPLSGAGGCLATGQAAGAQAGPPAPAVIFHHVHLNSADPAAAAAFYLRTFDVTKPATVAGMEGIQSEKMYLLFNRVPSAPKTSPDCAIWHFGWGSTDVEGDYKKHVANGVSFQTSVNKLGSGTLFAYMKAPEGALVEINSSQTRAFIHVHLYSEAPLCAAEWYQKNLGATGRARNPDSGSCEQPFAAPSEPLGVIRAPAASVRFGDVALIIYPRQHPGPLVSSRGHVVDHIGLSVENLDGLLESLRASGIKVLEPPHRFGKSDQRAAMIEGPDSIAIELVETK